MTTPININLQLPACSKPHEGAATKHDLEQMEGRIMSAISDYVAAVEAQHVTMEEATDAISTSLGGITSDVQFLKTELERIQNSPGAITPADQAALDAALARTTALATKVNGVKDAFKALDDATVPPTPPPVDPIPEPPVEPA